MSGKDGLEADIMTSDFFFLDSQAVCGWQTYKNDVFFQRISKNRDKLYRGKSYRENMRDAMSKGLFDRLLDEIFDANWVGRRGKS